MYAHTARQPLSPQRRKMVQKWLEQRSLYILQKARVFQHFCGFTAGSRLICWWSYYAVMKYCSFTKAVQYFFNHWLKYSKFKFFIKKWETKEWDQLLPSYVAKVAASKIRGHNMFSFTILSCLKLGCERPSSFKLMKFGIEDSKLSIFLKKILI